MGQQKKKHDNATDFVAALEKLIESKIYETHPDEVEMTRRRMIDYLLETDPRHGIYVKGEGE